MGRPISSEHNQTLINEWKRQILAVSWNGIGPAQGLRRLVSLLGLDLVEIDTGLRNRLKRALEELTATCAGLDEDNRADQPSAAVDAWIHRRLVAHGDDLLVPDQRRRALLARVRDQDRRRVHADRGLRSARVELPAESWRKLKRLGAQWGTTTIAGTLEQLIETQADGKTSGGIKKVGTARKRKETRQTSLPGLYPESRRR